MKNSACAIEEKRQAPLTMRDVSALDRLVDLVRNNKNKPFVPDDFERFRRELAERLREVGREALKEELRKADVDADSILLGRCPSTMSQPFQHAAFPRDLSSVSDLHPVYTLVRRTAGDPAGSQCFWIPAAGHSIRLQLPASLRARRSSRVSIGASVWT